MATSFSPLMQDHPTASHLQHVRRTSLLFVSEQVPQYIKISVTKFYESNESKFSSRTRIVATQVQHLLLRICVNDAAVSAHLCRREHQLQLKPI